MKLRKTLKMLVPILALIMLIGACNKAEAKETEGTKDTTAETTTTETTEEEDKEEETEDVADPEDDDSAFVTFDYSEWVPDQNIEIDENYMKFYDYDAFYTSTDYPELKMVESADEITNEILKAEAQKLLDDGYTLTTAEENAKVLYGEGFFDDQNLAVAYLYNGIDAWKEGKSSYDSIDCYLASQEIIDQIGYDKVSEADGIITYKDNRNTQCPSDAVITYDPETELLKIVNHYEWDESVTPVG
ncbi:MAG: hypothetical protein J6U23_15260 [Clostridiales bacterium]|nr:hypothetical protein [Clostridiales bacterium]